MAHEDVSVGFYFGREDFGFFVNVREESCCRIPGVEDYARESEAFCVEVEKFYSDLYLVFELRVVFSSGKLAGRQVGNYVDGKMLRL